MIMSLFITFEGPEGSGKSTQVRFLVEWLKERGFSVLSTREPGGTAIGNAVRQVLLDIRHTGMRPRTEVFLFSAARAQLVDEVIRPFLESGGVVVSDRYADSTLAYQGYGHGMDLGMLRRISEFATGGLWPDLTIYLDVPVEEGLRRKRKANSRGEGELNRLDMADVEFHRRVRNGYLALAESDPARWRVLDGTKPADALRDEIEKVVSEKLFHR